MTALILTSCATSYSDPPERLSIGIGLESVTDPDIDWASVRQRFDAAGVDAFTVSVGRPEWSGFAWQGYEDRWASAIAEADDHGHDPVGHIIDTLGGGTGRTVTLTIDVLSPLVVSENDELQGAFPDGSPAEDFPSATALYDGEVGKNLVDMCEAAATRYSPDRLAVTELLGDTFFSETDEDLFSEMTGQDGFPRTDDGDVDITDETVNQWQSQIITTMLDRCGDAASVEVEMDARVSWDEPASGRPDSGHRYQDIYDTGAHLTLWAYTGLSDVTPSATADLAHAMAEHYTREENGRTSISTGLWGQDDDGLSPEDLVTSIGAAASVPDGPPEVLVTPLSMITDAHWDAITELTGA